MAPISTKKQEDLPTLIALPARGGEAPDPEYFTRSIKALHRLLTGGNFQRNPNVIYDSPNYKEQILRHLKVLTKSSNLILVSEQSLLDLQEAIQSKEDLNSSANRKVIQRLIKFSKDEEPRSGATKPNCNAPKPPSPPRRVIRTYNA